MVVMFVSFGWVLTLYFCGNPFCTCCCFVVLVAYISSCIYTIPTDVHLYSHYTFSFFKQTIYKTEMCLVIGWRRSGICNYIKYIL